jgi:hypothetical protein
MEERGGNPMKKIIVILIGFGLLSLTTSGLASSPYQHQTALCAAVTNSQPSAWVLQKLGQEFFEQKTVRTVTDAPVAVRSVFVKGKDNRVYLVSRWYGFDAQAQYTFSCQWVDPDGQPHSVSSASFQTPESLDPGIFFTYTAFLDVGDNLKEGQWKVMVLLNGDLVDSRNLTIASE